MAASVEHDSPESMQAPQTAVEVEETKTFKDLVRVDDPSFPLFFLRQARAESGCLPSRPVVCGSSRGLAQISPRVPEAQVQDEGPPLTPSLGVGRRPGPGAPFAHFSSTWCGNAVFVQDIVQCDLSDLGLEFR